MTLRFSSGNLRHKSKFPWKRQIGILLLVFLPVITTDSLRAEPFTKIQLAAGPLYNIGENDFNRYWRYANGMGVQAQTPFYFGAAELGIELRSFDGYNSVDFQQVYCYLAFLKELTLHQNISGNCGISVGNSLFRFDSEENRRLQNESELTLGLKAGVTVLLKNYFTIQMGLSHLKIYTYHPITMTNVGLTVGIRMDTPEWLRNFLK